MKYLQKKPKATYSVRADKDLYVAVKETSKDFIIIEEIKPHENQETVETALLKYAKDNDLRPAFLDEIAKKSFTFQGETIKQKTVVKLDPEAFQKVAIEYIDQEKEVEGIENDYEQEKKDIKKQFETDMGDKRKILEGLKQIVYSGCTPVEVDATWERNVADREMVLVTCDTDEILQIRPMNPEELEKSNLFDGERTEGETDNDGKE